MTKLKIKVTKDILYESRFCGKGVGGAKAVGVSCAVSLAVRDVFPLAFVSREKIKVDGAFDNSEYAPIHLPVEAVRYIEQFDTSTISERLNMDEIEFEVEIPDSILEKINIDEIKPLLINHPTLKLVNC
jgi:hypothetical protein